MVVGHTDYPPNKLYKQDGLVQPLSATKRKMRRTGLCGFLEMGRRPLLYSRLFVK